MIHAGFVDDGADQRKEFLADEIERAVQGVSPSRQQDFLAALGNEFPTWESAVVETRGAADPAGFDVQGLLRGLLARLGELSDSDRRALAARLKETGGGDAVPDFGEHHLEVWKRLGVGPAQAPSLERAWRLLGTLLEFYLSLDQLGWTLWRNLVIKSAFWKETELGKQAGPYLSGDREVSSEQTRQTIERTRRLIAALVGAPGRAAMDFANEHAARFSPENIEQAARGEKRTLESLDAACWREYKQRYLAVGTPVHLEAAIQKNLAQAAEDLIGGRAR